ncbi:hypothetical protein CAMSH0001_0875 [Campylobacter showae RM3277]|uniref:Uncharacterized protein n=1 Tax=Campylobacter showae RM3277 TaxID=553219 RepID=C6RHP8_9BACT|nr:hypothetical protein CAMSH0001_0875 [Campylobacter showae RM3277]
MIKTKFSILKARVSVSKIYIQICKFDSKFECKESRQSVLR